MSSSEEKYATHCSPIPGYVFEAIAANTAKYAQAYLQGRVDEEFANLSPEAKKLLPQTFKMAARLLDFTDGNKAAVDEAMKDHHHGDAKAVVDDSEETIAPGQARRIVRDAQGGQRRSDSNKLVRAEGDKPSGDAVVNQAYDFSGIVRDFYKNLHGRDSLDNKGMDLRSTVHFGKGYSNAFWDGYGMYYGDGDGYYFGSFTASLDVVGHEFTHGVTSNSSNLEYYSQPGALNESFSDVFGLLIKHFHNKTTVDKADWLIGPELILDGFKKAGGRVDAIRTMKGGKAYENSPMMGSDPQPKHMKDYYTGSRDNQGVHINSGIPNHAFYLAAMELGGLAYEKLGQVWYKTLMGLNTRSTFVEMAQLTIKNAAEIHGLESAQFKALTNAWQKVGVLNAKLEPSAEYQEVMAKVAVNEAKTAKKAKKKAPENDNSASGANQRPTGTDPRP